MTGAANSRSIAWAVALAVKNQGGAVALTFQAKRLRRRLQALAEELGGAPMIELDWAAMRPSARRRRARRTHAGARRMVHSIAWAPAHDLQGSFVETTRDGFAQANDISSTR